ncbi:MAG: hypothetical protein F8N37_12070 [Telmatospirillum sp.]|nr:hypothetical protein [Telmatospirillum sp.]
MNPCYHFEDYPKALYLNGHHIEVEDQREERARRREGFDDWAADRERIEAASGTPAPQQPDDEEPADDPVDGQGGTEPAAGAQQPDLLDQ